MKCYRLLQLMLRGEETFLDHHCWKTNYSYPKLRDYLLHVLGSCSRNKILVFVETRRVAEKIAKKVSDYLKCTLSGRFEEKFRDLHPYTYSNNLWCEYDNSLSDKFGAIDMRGDLPQEKREENLNLFKDGVYPIMVSTNVLARGIDIEGITHVINFDMPLNLHSIPEILMSDRQALEDEEIDEMPERYQFEEYIHRIGRTGRAGNKGKSISFFQRHKDRHLAIPLAITLSKAQQDVPKWLEEIAYNGQSFVKEASDASSFFSKLGQKIDSFKIMKSENEIDKQRMIKDILENILTSSDKTFWSPKHKFCPAKNSSATGDGNSTMQSYLSHMLGKCSSKRIIIFVDKGRVEEVADLVSRHLLDVLVNKFSQHREVRADLKLKDDLTPPNSNNYYALRFDNKSSQTTRENVLKNFEEGQHPILVCTNEIIRGIDIKDVTHIINFDLPPDLKYFPRFQNPRKQKGFHKIWPVKVEKKKRKTKTGVTITFFQRDKDNKLAKPLLYMLRADNKLNIPRWLIDLVDEQDPRRKTGGKPPAGGSHQDWDEVGGVGAHELWGDTD